MKIYLLKRKYGLKLDNNPWDIYSDMLNECVVIANGEEEARQLADKESLGENIKKGIKNVWLNADYTDCEEINPSSFSEAKILIRDETNF